MPGRKFAPQPGEKISFLGETFTVQAHPKVSYMAYAASGRRATVYRLVAGKRTLALKVFKPFYRDPALERNSHQLRQFLDLEGFTAADRRVVLPSEAAVKSCPDLAYALLMPWLQGTTWFDLLVEARKSVRLQSPTAIHLCERFLRVMKELERRGIAHTDIAPGNVILDVKSLSVELLDLEDLYAPGLPRPTHLHGGSTGYRHGGNGGRPDVWCAEGDRYAAAVMAAEILVLAETGLAVLANDEGFFQGHHRTQIGKERYTLALPWLHALAPDFLDVFRRAWSAEHLQDCPPLTDLHAAIAATAVRTPLSQAGTLADPKVETEQTQPQEIPVEWIPFEAIWELASTPARGAAVARRKSRTPKAAPPQPPSLPPPPPGQGHPFRVAMGVAFVAGAVVWLTTGEPLWFVVLLGLGFLLGFLLQKTLYK